MSAPPFITEHSYYSYYCAYYCSEAYEAAERKDHAPGYYDNVFADGHSHMPTAHESERTARGGGGGGGGEAGDRANVDEDLRNKAVERLKARGADVKAAKPHLLKPPQFTHWNQKELADKEEDWQAKRDKEVAQALMPMHH